MSITSQFQSTLPVWGGTQLFRHGMQVHRHFNPPSPCGEGQFSPRRRARTRSFQSTLPVWGGTCSVWDVWEIWRGISIHPPRVGRDFDVFCCCSASLISIHPPRVGRDVRNSRIKITATKFQSTLPVWGGTLSALPTNRLW